MLGPLFRLEAIRTSRRGRAHALRAMVGLAMLVYLFNEWAYWNHQAGQMPRAPSRMVAEAIFSRFGIVLWGAVALLVPAMTAGTIGAEVRKKTLPDLFTTRLSTAEILLSKVAVGWLSVLGGLIVAAPFLAIVGLLGGLEPVLVGFVLGVSAATLLFLGGLSALIAAALPRSGAAISGAILASLTWLALPLLVMNFLGGRLGVAPTSLREQLATGFILTHPLLDLVVLQQRAWQRMIRPSIGWRGGGFRLDDWFIQSIALYSILGLLLLALAVLVLHARRVGWIGEKRGSPRRFAESRRSCGDRPMLWKERYAPGHILGSNRASIAMAILAVAGTITSLWGPIRTSLHFGQTMDSLVDQVRTTFVYLDLIALLSAALLGALSVSSERERGTWDGLRTTMVTAREIVVAKQLGVLWSLRWLLAGFAALWLIGYLGRAVSIFGVIFSAIGLITFTWSATALGVAMSIAGRSTTRALLLTLAVLGVSQVIAIVPVMLLFDRLHFSPIYALTMTTPYLEWVALFSPNESIFAPSPPVSAYASNPLLAKRGGDLVPVILLANLIHLAAGSALTWASIHLLDARAPRPKRAVGSVVSVPRRPALDPGALA